MNYNEKETKYALYNPDTKLYMSNGHGKFLSTKDWSSKPTMWSKQDLMLTWVYKWSIDFPNLEIQTFLIETTQKSPVVIDHDALEKVEIISEGIKLNEDDTRYSHVPEMLTALKVHKRYMVFFIIPNWEDKQSQVATTSFVGSSLAHRFSMKASAPRVQMVLPLQPPGKALTTKQTLKQQIKTIIKKGKITEFVLWRNDQRIIIASSTEHTDMVMLKLTVDGNLSQHYFDKVEKKFL